MILVTNETPVGRQDEVGAEWAQRPPAAVIDGGENTQVATRAAIPDDFYLYLVCAPGSASQLRDLRLAKQLQELAVGASAILDQMIP